MASGAGLTASVRRAGGGSAAPRVPPSGRPAHGAVLGMPISAVTDAELLDAISDAVQSRTPTVFVGLYAALFRRLAHDAYYRALVANSVTYPDGNGVVTELHKRGIGQARRLATTDMALPIVQRAARCGWRVGLYGAGPDVVARAAEMLAQHAPGVQIVQAWNGYSRGPTVDQLRAARVDVLFVGLGAPLQEAWSYEIAALAGVSAVLTCGGLFDFLAGDKRRAPAWVQRAGLEWAFRVLLEPRRRFARYFVGNGYFLWRVRGDRVSCRMHR
jgi:N-acetylglucosaminyldiphosphoundecaprenol N-acetyl-beta-D-mannosaminyltransferase